MRVSAPLLGIGPDGEGGIVNTATKVMHSTAAVISEPMIFVVIIVSLVESKRLLFIELTVGVWMAGAAWPFVVGVFNMATTLIMALILVLIMTLVVLILNLMILRGNLMVLTLTLTLTLIVKCVCVWSVGVERV